MIGSISEGVVVFTIRVLGNAFVVGKDVVVGGKVVGGISGGRTLSAKVTLFCSTVLTPRSMSLTEEITDDT